MTTPSFQVPVQVNGTTVNANVHISIDPITTSNPPPPPAVPGMPTNVVAVAGNAQATVIWAAPSLPSNPAISGYTVTATPGGAHVAVTAAATSAVVAGLTNGTAYAFAVTATNAIGVGPASAPSPPVTPAAPPPPPPPSSFKLVGQATANLGAGAGSAIVTLPTPAVAGNLLVATGGIFPNNAAVTSPAGFLLAGVTPGDASAGGAAIWYKVAAGGERALTFAQPAGSSNYSQFSVFEISGLTGGAVDGAVKWDDFTSAVAGYSQTYGSAPLAAGELAFAFFLSTSATLAGTPGGWTVLSGPTAINNDMGHYMATAGATPPSIVLAGIAPAGRATAGMAVFRSGAFVPPPPPPPPSTTYDHIFLIALENADRKTVIGNGAAPRINALATQFAQSSGFHATSHPSLPNYLQVTCGSTQGTDGGNDGIGTISVPNIFANITAAGLQWRAYVEDLPSRQSQWNGSGAWQVGNYAARHAPAVFYDSVVNNATEAAKVVNFNIFSSDLAAGKAPAFAFITPNIQDDMHTGSIATCDAWVSNAVAVIQGSTAWTKDRSLIVLWWDEDAEDGQSNDQQVAFIAIAKDVKPGFTSAASIGHLNLLATIEKFLGLTTDLAGGAAPITDMFSSVAPPPPPPPSGARLFGPNSPWNTVKTGLSFVSAADGLLSGSNYGINNGAFTHPFYVAKSSDPVTTFHLGAGWGYPATTITAPAPSGMVPASGSDGALTVLLADGTLLDMFSAKVNGTTITASFYGLSDGINGPGFGGIGLSNPWQAIGTTAIGSPQAGGTILARDAAAGVIAHGLCMAWDYSALGGSGTSGSPAVSPAVSNDCGGGPGPLPEGGLLVIASGTAKPSGLSVGGSALWDACVKYGVFITDQLGGQPMFYSDGSSAVNNFIAGNDYTTVGRALRLVKTW